MATIKRSFLVITCILSLLIPPASIVYADQDGSDVSIGVEAVTHYTAGPGTDYPDPTTAWDAVAGLYDIVSDPNTSWLWQFGYSNGDCWERDWKATGRLGGDDATYTDNVDLNAFCGHGFGRCYVFTTDIDDWYTTVSDLDMGDRDCEWMLAITCNFLNGTMSQFGPIADGVHLVCGYCTDMTVTANAGEWFAEYAMPNPEPYHQAYGVRVA